MPLSSDRLLFFAATPICFVFGLRGVWVPTLRLPLVFIQKKKEWDTDGRDRRCQSAPRPPIEKCCAQSLLLMVARCRSVT